MPGLLEPKYKRGDRVRITGLRTMPGVLKVGCCGTVRRTPRMLVPACAAEGLPAPADWTWFAYNVALDDGYAFDGLPEANLNGID